MVIEKSMSQLDNLKELKKMLANCILETTLDESTGCENFNITQGLLITEYLTKRFDENNFFQMRCAHLKAFLIRNVSFQNVQQPF